MTLLRKEEFEGNTTAGISGQRLVSSPLPTLRHPHWRARSAHAYGGFLRAHRGEGLLDLLRTGEQRLGFGPASQALQQHAERAAVATHCAVLRSVRLLVNRERALVLHHG